jgi:hypothetical protein
VRLQFFDEGRIAMNHVSTVCADPTVASNIGAQCCNAPTHEAVCPSETAEDGDRVVIFDYVRRTGVADRGDGCDSQAGGKCPVGCKLTHPYTAPWCVLEVDETDSQPCHLDVGGVVSSGGGECLYVAEPMTYATAEHRCTAEYTNGGMCDQRLVVHGESTIDGQSPDWQATCAGFMLSWTNNPCTSVTPKQYQQQALE